MVEYSYDAWGNHNSYGSSNGDLAHVNPIRYRGYYYDVDIGLYYLNSRYYNPQWRRFISPDSTEYIDPETPNGLNLYCYCNNDPINYADPSGHSIILTAALTLMGIGITVGIGYATYTDYQDDSSINGSVGWQTYVGSAMIGGAIGFGLGYFGPAIASLLGSSFSFALPTLGTLNTGGALALSGSVTLTGAQIAGGALVAGLGIMTYTVGKSGGYIVKKYPNDHDPSHVHIYGDDIPDKAHGIRIGSDGKPLPGQGKLPPGAKKAIKKLLEQILKALSQ